MCERFHCLPSQARQEWAEHGWFLEDVMEAMAYADTKQACDTAAKHTHIERPEGEMADLVQVIDMELAQEALDKAKGNG